MTRRLAGILTVMKKIDITALRERIYSSLTEEEREEADRVLRAYLAVCARIYEHSVMRELLEKSVDEDSASKDSAV